jgi:biopolymer transport protein TolR
MRHRRAMSEINVVPYIDVMLVLLIIFMVAAPMLPTGSVDLPSVGKSSTPPAAALEVLIRADQSFALRDHSGNAPERTVTRSELAAAVAEARRGDSERPVLIAGDKSVRYELVLEVMDELQRQQVKRVGLLIQPSGR